MALFYLNSAKYFSIVCLVRARAALYHLVRAAAAAVYGCIYLPCQRPERPCAAAYYIFIVPVSPREARAGCLRKLRARVYQLAERYHVHVVLEDADAALARPECRRLELQYLALETCQLRLALFLLGDVPLNCAARLEPPAESAAETFALFSCRLR